MHNRLITHSIGYIWPKLPSLLKILGFCVPGEVLTYSYLIDSYEAVKISLSLILAESIGSNDAVSS